MSLRTSLQRLARRDPDRPTLRERAASLKAGLARLAHRRPPEEADPGRRAVMGGALAAAVPLPALAAPVVAGPHPDQAVFDAEAAMLRAECIHEAATAARDAASAAVDAELGICPADLLATQDELSVFNSPFGPREVRACRSFKWVRADETDDDSSGSAWTPEGLRMAIRWAVPLLGKGGRTPHRIRRWRALLPIAEAFEARRTEIRGRHRLDDLSNAYWDTGRAVSAARRAMDGALASTPEGLAVLVRTVGSYGWRDMREGWPALLLSAAIVSSVDLREPEEPRVRTTFM